MTGGPLSESPAVTIYAQLLSWSRIAYHLEPRLSPHSVYFDQIPFLTSAPCFPQD